VDDYQNDDKKKLFISQKLFSKYHFKNIISNQTSNVQTNITKIRLKWFQDETDNSIIDWQLILVYNANNKRVNT